MWSRASQTPCVPSITVLLLQSCLPKTKQQNHEMARNSIYVSNTQVQCLHHNFIILLNQSHLVLVIPNLINEVLHKQKSISIGIKVAASGLKLGLMRAGLALLLLGPQKDFSMQCLRSGDNRKKMVRICICAPVTWSFCAVLFSGVQSRGQSFLKYSDLTSPSLL